VLDKLIVQRGVSTDLVMKLTLETYWLIWCGLLNSNVVARR